MSYDSKELSTQDATPIMLYEFKRSNPFVTDTTAWRYAAFPIDVVSNGDTFSSESVECSKISATGKLAKESITVKVPLTNPLGQLFIGLPPDLVTTLTIYRTHYDDTERRVAWKGRVLRGAPALDGVTLHCEPIFTSMARAGLRRVYQRLCTRQFGVPGCNVDIEALKQSFFVSAIAGCVVQINSLSGEWRGGMLRFANVARMITEQTLSPATVTLMRPNLALSAAVAAAGEIPVSVYLYPNCPRTTSACLTYGNIGNYGGEPGIRYVNPFSNVSSIF